LKIRDLQQSRSERRGDKTEKLGETVKRFIELDYVTKISRIESCGLGIFPAIQSCPKQHEKRREIAKVAIAFFYSVNRYNPERLRNVHDILRTDKSNYADDFADFVPRFESSSRNMARYH